MCSCLRLTCICRCLVVFLSLLYNHVPCPSCDTRPSCPLSIYVSMFNLSMLTLPLHAHSIPNIFSLNYFLYSTNYSSLPISLFFIFLVLVGDLCVCPCLSLFLSLSSLQPCSLLLCSLNLVMLHILLQIMIIMCVCVINVSVSHLCVWIVCVSCSHFSHLCGNFGWKGEGQFCCLPLPSVSILKGVTGLEQLTSDNDFLFFTLILPILFFLN